MSWTLTTSGAAILKAGLNANSTIIASGASLAKWSDEAEAVLCTHTRYDLINNYSNINTNFKPIFDDAASDIIAMRIINYDMSGYTSRTEAQTMLDVIRDNLLRNLELIKDDKNKEKILIIP